MPKLDQTGPRGQGPMTGRGMGPCGGGARGRRGMGYGMGCGCGYGYGRYMGRNYLTKNEEVEDLPDEAKYLEKDLKAVKERIAELKK